MKTNRAIYIVLLVGLFAFSLARFAYDALRLVYPVNDLTPIWVSSKAFVAGHNPYSDTQAFERAWAETGIVGAEDCPDYNCIVHKYPMGYPPPALPLFAPLALFKWRPAVNAYLATSIILFAAMILVLAGKLRLPWDDPRKLYMIAFALAMAPLHAGVHHSNVNTLVIVFLGAGVICLNDRPRVAGVALGIGMCLKPQVAFLFFAYPWLRKRWKTALTELIVSVVISAGSLLWFGLHHLNVVKAYLDSLDMFIGRNSFHMESPVRYTLINLQVLVFQFTHSEAASNVISWTLFLLLTATWVFLTRSRNWKSSKTTDLAIISVLTLFPVYQNIYTATLLVFVVYWAIENWRLARAKAALLVMLPLLLPLATMTWEFHPLASFIERHHLGSSFIWNAFIMPHVIWIELSLVAILLSTLRRKAPISSFPASIPVSGRSPLATAGAVRN